MLVYSPDTTLFVQKLLTNITLFFTQTYLAIVGVPLLGITFVLVVCINLMTISKLIATKVPNHHKNGNYIYSSIISIDSGRAERNLTLNTLALAAMMMLIFVMATMYGITQTSIVATIYFFVGEVLSFILIFLNRHYQAICFQSAIRFCFLWRVQHCKDIWEWLAIKWPRWQIESNLLFYFSILYLKRSVKDLLHLPLKTF